MFLFICQTNCRNLKSLYKIEPRLKQSWFAILKKGSRYKVLNFEVDFLKTEVFQIEQNGSQATIFPEQFSKQKWKEIVYYNFGWGLSTEIVITKNVIK